MKPEKNHVEPIKNLKAFITSYIGSKSGQANVNRPFRLIITPMQDEKGNFERKEFKFNSLAVAFASALKE